MRYLDICSGISAPTMAWKPLGWQALCFAEIEAAPRAVLAHHYPDVPLRGDFTEIEGTEYGPVDLLVGGTPCQPFSVAGLRGGLADDRGNLALQFARLAGRARPRWVVWENVPGVLSIDGGRAFGSILGALAELGYGLAYRVLDAQHFGVPQRRRRVFVVGYLGDWRRAAAVLFERHCLQGHPAPRREKGQSAPTISGRSSAGGGLGTDVDCDGGLIQQTAPTLNAAFGSKLGLDNQHIDSGAGLFIAHSLRVEGFDASEDGTGRGTPLVPVHCFDARQSDVIQYGDKTGPIDTDGWTHAVAIQKRAVSENPDAGPDGAGFRTDGMAYTLEARSVPQAVAFDTTQITSAANYSNPKPGDPCHPLAGGQHPPAICFSAKDHGADAMDDLSPTLRAGGHSGSHANVGVMPAVAFPINPNALRGNTTAKTPSPDANGKARLRDPGLGVGRAGDPADTLQAAGPGAVGYASAVRRLTPRECERLQGFPDDFTLVPNRGKPMADGPRYKMLGNSMAVPVLAWIGERIAAVDHLSASERHAA